MCTNGFCRNHPIYSPEWDKYLVVDSSKEKTKENRLTEQIDKTDNKKSIVDDDKNLIVGAS